MQKKIFKLLLPIEKKVEKIENLKKKFKEKPKNTKILIKLGVGLYFSGAL
jgi:hypothetical protein